MSRIGRVQRRGGVTEIRLRYLGTQASPRRDTTTRADRCSQRNAQALKLELDGVGVGGDAQYPTSGRSR